MYTRFNDNVQKENQLRCLIIHTMQTSSKCLDYASLFIVDIHGRRPLHCTDHTQWKLHSTPIAKSVVYPVPVCREVRCVKVIKCVKMSSTVWIFTTLIFKQKPKNIGTKVHCKPASFIHSHLQTSIYYIQESTCTIQYVTDQGLGISKVPV